MVCAFLRLEPPEFSRFGVSDCPSSRKEFIPIERSVRVALPQMQGAPRLLAGPLVDDVRTAGMDVVALDLGPTLAESI